MAKHQAAVIKTVINALNTVNIPDATSLCTFGVYWVGSVEEYSAIRTARNNLGSTFVITPRLWRPPAEEVHEGI